MSAFVTFAKAVLQTHGRRHIFYKKGANIPDPFFRIQLTVQA